MRSIFNRSIAASLHVGIPRASIGSASVPKAARIKPDDFGSSSGMYALYPLKQHTAIAVFEGILPAWSTNRGNPLETPLDCSMCPMPSTRFAPPMSRNRAMVESENTACCAAICLIVNAFGPTKQSFFNEGETSSKVSSLPMWTRCRCVHRHRYPVKRFQSEAKTWGKYCGEGDGCSSLAEVRSAVVFSFPPLHLI